MKLTLSAQLLARIRATAVNLPARLLPLLHTEASFQTAASCLALVSDLDRLGSEKPDNGETASRGNHACPDDNAA